jgi:hypothetical protein
MGGRMSTMKKEGESIGWKQIQLPIGLCMDKALLNLVR